MDKRLGLAIALSMGILFLWWKIFPPQPPPAAPPPPVAQAPASPPGAPSQWAPPPAAAPAPAPGTAGAGAAAAPPAALPAEEQVILDSPDARYLFTSWGGALRELRVKEPKFRERKDDPSSGLAVVQASSRETASLQVKFPRADFKVPEPTPFAVSRPAPDTVIFRAETEAVVLEKRYHVLPGRFQLQLDVTVQNRTARALNESLALHLYGRQDPEKKGGSFLSYASANLAEMACSFDGKVERANIEALFKEPKKHDGNVLWVAADEKFFTLAAVPFPQNPQPRSCGQRALDQLDGEAWISFASRNLGPGETASYGFVVFGGPKYREDLDQVRPAGQDAHLDNLVNVTFAVLSRPMLALLKIFHRFTGNWGLAIILLTIFVKLVTFYPTQRTMLSAKKMQRLAPKMAALKKKYENDKQRLGVETMNLYKAHGVSPLGGCLPTLIQMPIWIALFSTLNYAVELHRSSFLYIHDLSAKDPYYLTPLLMGGVMVLQMRMSPAGADPQQQKMMSVMMPIMFTVFSLFLPAGLAIYTLTSYLLGILQQLYINHLDRKSSGGVPAKA
jgi:YidC/Oxa1 family membrane protein insertase